MYAMYLRKSRKDNEIPGMTAEQVLSRHETTLTELASSRGYKIEKIYREVVSGETIAARPRMQELLAEVEHGVYEGVLVVEIERLARGNSIDQGIVSQTFMYSGTLIITPSKIYDPSNEMDEEFFEFGLFMSRREYKTINRRLQAGKAASHREGKYVGGIAPYGYDRVKLQGQKGWTLTPNADAETVKLIFELYTRDENRMGCIKICSFLDSLGIKPVKADKWAFSCIRNILRNETYTGKIVHGKYSADKKIIDGKVYRKRDFHKEYTLYDGVHEAIISEETFAKAARYLDLNPGNPAHDAIANPLAGLLVCGKCGRRMERRTPSKVQPKAYILCRHKCGNVGSPLDIIEKRVYDAIVKWVKDIKLEIPQSVKPCLNTSAIEQLSKEINRVEQQIDKLYDFLEQGVYDVATYNERRFKLKATLNNLKQQSYNLINEDKINMEKYTKKLNQLPQAEYLISAYDTLDAAEKNKILRELFSKIVYTKTTPGSHWHPELIDKFEIELFSNID